MCNRFLIFAILKTDYTCYAPPFSVYKRALIVKEIKDKLIKLTLCSSFKPYILKDLKEM